MKASSFPIYFHEAGYPRVEGAQLSGEPTADLRLAIALVARGCLRATGSVSSTLDC